MKPLTWWPRRGRQWRASVTASLNAINEKLESFVSASDDIAAAAAAINSAVATLGTVTTDLTNAVGNIQAEITALQNANPAVDTTALNAAVASLNAPLAALQAADTAVDALETPAPPASA